MKGSTSFKQSCLFTLGLSILFTSILFAQSKPSLAQRWEYKTVYNVSEADLDKLGDEGWELVTSAYQPNSNSLYYTLKRLKPVNAPKYIDPAKRPAPPAHTPACNLSLTQAPIIRGLRLGMNVDELIELFPGANPNELKGKVEQAKGEPALGYADFRLAGSQHKERLESLNFRVILFDARVTVFAIDYTFNNSTNIGQAFNEEQTIDRLVEAFELPGKEYWQKESGNVFVKCRDFIVGGSIHSRISIQVTDTSKESEEKSKQRRNEALAKKRAEFKP